MKIKQGLFVIVYKTKKIGDEEEEEENKRKTQLKEKAK